MNNFDENVAKWLSLSNAGKFEEAKDFYFDTLFSSVLNRFEDKYKSYYVCTRKRSEDGSERLSSQQN